MRAIRLNLVLNINKTLKTTLYFLIWTKIIIHISAQKVV
jgi:hypothetical protein